MSVFVQNRKKREIFAFCVITFKPILSKTWPEKVVQRSFIKEHSFPNSLYFRNYSTPLCVHTTTQVQRMPRADITGPDQQRRGPKI